MLLNFAKEQPEEAWVNVDHKKLKKPKNFKLDHIQVIEEMVGH